MIGGCRCVSSAPKYVYSRCKGHFSRISRSFACNSAFVKFCGTRVTSAERLDSQLRKLFDFLFTTFVLSRSEDSDQALRDIRVSYLFSVLGSFTAGVSLVCTPTTLLYSACCDGTHEL